MPFIPAENIARVEVVQTLHGQIIENVFHVDGNGPWDSGRLVELCEIFIGHWNDDIAELQSTNVQYSVVKARDLTVEEGVGVEVQFPPLSGGDVAMAAMPGSVALTIKWITGLTGRSRRGRTYLSGIPETSQEGNEVTLVYRDTAVDRFNTLKTLIAGQGRTLGVCSFFDGMVFDPVKQRRVPVPRANGVFTPIIGCTADTFLDSQRRRLSGRGK